MLKLVDSAYGFGKVIVSDAEYVLDQFNELTKYQENFGITVIYRKTRTARPELKVLGRFDEKIVEALVRQINDEEEADERHLFDGWDEQAMERQS